MAGQFTPIEVARAYRAEHPGKFDEFDDAELIKAIELEDPETFALIDPVLIGAELLAPFKGQKPPARPTGPAITPPPLGPSGTEMAISTGLRVVPAVAGGLATKVPLLGQAIGGVTGFLGEAAGQAFEKRQGLREEYEPRTMVVEGALNAAPFAWTRHLGRAGRVAAGTGMGAALGGTSAGMRTLLEEERVPTFQDVGAGMALGAGFGLGTGAGMEAISAVNKRLGSVGSTDYGLPTDVAPPTLVDRFQHQQVASQLQRAEREMQASEISREFARRGWEIPPDQRGSLRQGMEAKQYLETVADLLEETPGVPVRIPEIGLPPELQAVAADVPSFPQALTDEQRALNLRGQAELRQPPRPGPIFAGEPPPALPPARPIEVFPSDVPIPPADELAPGAAPRRIQMPSTLDRLTDELDRGLTGGTVEGPPRLTQSNTLRLRPPALDVPRETVGDLPFAPPPPPDPNQPIRQSRGVYQEPTPDAPRLPGVDQPQPLDRRYAEGPNAGPRREGELHGKPRPRGWRRQVKLPGGVKYEYADSPLPAEDPGTYPAEVRRELAAMLWELDTYRYERVAGGSTTGQIDVLTEELGDVSSAVAEARRRGATSGGAIAGAPVYHDIIKAARGPAAHATRDDILQQLRGALLEGRGSVVSDAAAQVARARLAQRAAGAKAGAGPHKIVATRGDEGDDLIGWVDETGARALPEQDLDEFARTAREADDAELLAAVEQARVSPGSIPPEIQPFYDAAAREVQRRGLREPQPQGLWDRLSGETGSIRKDLLFGDEPPDLEETIKRRSMAEWEPPRMRSPIEMKGEVPDNPVARALEAERQRIEAEYLAAQQEEDVPLPGLEQVREQDVPTPELDAPFSLTPPPARPSKTPPRQPSLLDRLKDEAGVLILDIPAGDRTGLRQWLRKQEKEHGGEAWYSRVEQAIEDGEWDRAWKSAAAASVRSYAKAYSQAKTPEQKQLLQRTLKGTPLQADVNTEIIAGARQREGDFDAPAPPDFPPSARVTQAGAARGDERLGPAGIINPGPRKRPLSSVAPTLRGSTLDSAVVKLLLESTSPEGMATVPGNQDTMLRLYRQVGEAVYRGQNLKLLREAGVKIAPEELAQHFNATVSDWGRGLQMLQQFALQHREVLEEAAEQMSMGGALRGMLGSRGGPPPLIVGARNRPIGRMGSIPADRTLDVLANDTRNYEAAMLANTLQRRKPVGPLRALHDASYAWMLSKWNTAVRNYISFTGRYSIDSLDHALTIPTARLLGDEPTAQLSSALLRERGLQPMGRTGTAVPPTRSWKETLQEIYDFEIDQLNRLKPNDARRAIRLLLDQPEEMARYLGTMTGEDLSSGFSNTPVLRHLTNPAVQRFLTMFNRAQEFSARATVFDATMRALIRARGLDPTTVLQKSADDIAQLVGGRPAFDDLLQVATDQALEATFAGRTAKDSLPGALIRFINAAWPLKLGIPFPRFNFSAAPRWIYDHSPAALLDLVRFPLDAAGITAPPGTAAGGRLYRGVRAQTIERKALPELTLKITQAERRQGTALGELLATQREFQIRSRQVARLQARAAQGPLPGVDTLQQAQDALAQLSSRRTRLKGEMQSAREAVTDLRSQQTDLLDVLADARGINAPNFSQYMARIATGTVGMLGAAWVVRSQEAAQGTRWYEYRVDREGKDPIVLDFRPFAPFAQYLFVADVLQDLYTHTDWEKARAQADEVGGAVQGPLDWNKAIWDNYEGKYTAQELGAQFAQAFLSISRAAGTTLTLTDLLTQNGWPSLQDAADSIVGTMGQFLSRFTVPGQQISDVAGEFDPEEAKARIPPRATADDPMRPLAGPIANVPYARQVIPERISQTTGQPVAAEYPLLRALAGIGSAPRDFVVEEVRRIGLPGPTVFIRETGDYGLDRLVAEKYSAILQEALPQILEHESYRQLGTPARQRDFMQRYIFPDLKRAALGEVRAAMGQERFEEATVRGEEARRRRRLEALMEELGPETPVEDDGSGSPEAPPPPPF